MSDKLENITASGVDITIKGKEYKLGIFGMRDLADFRQYVKGQRIKLIQDTITNADERIKIISGLLDGHVDEMKEMSTMDGVCFMLWKSLQKYQPDITLVDVDKLVDLDNIKEISNAITQIGGQVKNSPKAKEVKS